MRRIRMVRKRDGRLVPFDERKIADAIYKAALSVGGADRFLAEELSEVVTVFLEKNPEVSVPTIEQIQDMVEKVLIETGHAKTAKAYILYREERRRVREVRGGLQASQIEPLPDGPRILDLARERTGTWREETLAASLASSCDLPDEVADEIAAQVASLVLSSGNARIAASTVAALADAELFRKGLLGERSGLSGLPRERIRDLLRPRDSKPVRDAASAAGRILLRTYSLEEVHSPEVAAAHVEGRIHVHGLEAPCGLVGGSVRPDVAVRWAEAPEPAGPIAAAATMGRTLARVARAIEGRFAADDVNVALSPLARGLPTERVRELVAVFLDALDGLVEINVDTEVPPLLAIEEARDARGHGIGVCYGELAHAARTVLFSVLDLWEAGAAADVPRLALHLGPRGLDDPDLLDRACSASLARRPITFVRMRDGRPAAGCSVLRGQVRDLSAAGEGGAFALGKVTLHLPTAAVRSLGGSPTRFLAECAEAMNLALRALHERISFLRKVGTTPGAPLEALSRGGSLGLVDLDLGAGIVGLAGLNEAVEICLGRELHEEDEALKLGERVAAFLRLQVQEGLADGAPEIVVSESWEPEVLERLRSGADRLTAGARLRNGAPIDLVTRIEREGRFHPVLGSATIAAIFPSGESVPPASAAALVRKTFANTPADGLRLGREAG